MQQLSSSFATIWHKFVSPFLWIGGFGFGTWLVWFGQPVGPPPPDKMRYLFLTGWLVFSPILIWHALRLRKVSLGHREIVVSNFEQHVSIPFSEIASVKQSRFTNPFMITLLLTRENALGSKVVFIPPRPWPVFADHDVTVLLRDLTDQNRHATASAGLVGGDR